MADPTATAFLFDYNYTLEHCRSGSDQSLCPIGLLADPGIKDASTRGVVRTAIPLARPSKIRAMIDYEAGYLRALKDVEITVQQMVKDLGTSTADKVGLLAVVSLLDGMIKAKLQRSGDADDKDPPGPLSGSL